MLDLTGGRLAVALGEPAYARVGVNWESREPITALMLEQLEELGLPLATVLHETHGIAA
jgi:hypothetical protein